MKKSDYFLKAAELVHNSEEIESSYCSHFCCCQAITRATPEGCYTYNMHDLFEEYFIPDWVGKYDYWFGTPYQLTIKPKSLDKHNERMQHRIFALLLMSEITKATE